jgi:hypothetical protein
MKIFLAKVFIFTLLIALTMSFPAYVLLYSGETMPLEKVIDLQLSSNEVIYGPAYNNFIERYKFLTVIKRKPRVIALGTSRIMQFSSLFFNDGDIFYNAGGGADKISHFRYFLDKIPKKIQPEIIIVGLDQWFFNYNWDPLKGDNYQERFLDESNFGKVIVKNTFNVWRDFAVGKITLTNIAKIRSGGANMVGLNAFVRGNGLRSDGSYYYKEIIDNGGMGWVDYADYQFQDTLSRIKTGTNRFEYGQSVNKPAVDELQRFLSLCAERNVYVIGVLPSFAPRIYKALHSRQAQYAYLFDLKDILTPLFERYNFELYDFTSIDRLSAGDNEFIDGFHGSEKIYLRMLIEMLRLNSRLNDYADLENLTRELNNSKNDLEVY